MDELANPTLLPRGLTSRVETLLGSVPVVVIEGPRASGKTALGTMLAAAGLVRTFADLSDPTVRTAAEASPGSFVEGLATPAFIDEAQLVPELTVAIKRAVDRTGAPGTFVLTGSSRLGRAELGGSDPLAGRAGRVRLWPMTQSELAGVPFNFATEMLDLSVQPAGSAKLVSHDELLTRVRRGGIPNLAGVNASIDADIRAMLAGEYVDGVLHHETGRRHDRSELQRTFRYLAATTSRILNVSSVASELASKRDTVQARLSTLEAAFLLHTLSAHRPGEHRVVTAHPKVHVVDTALACWAARVGRDPDAGVWGSLVETFVINELAAQIAWATEPLVLRHWRDTVRKVEVDAVIVGDRATVAVEVKAANDVRPDDLTGLRAFLRDMDDTHRGIVFYTGGLALRLDDRIWAVPIRALWDGLSR